MQKIISRKVIWIMLALLVVASLNSGCLPRRADDQFLGPTSTQNLPLGISVLVPREWQVTVIANNRSDADINAAIENKERITILDMQFNDPVDARVNVRAFLQLVSSEQEFIPYARAKNMTEEEFRLMGETIIDLDKELASRNRQPSRLLEWQVRPDQVSGHFAIRQDGLGTRGDGQVRTLYQDIYLPNATGLAVRLLADTHVQGHMEILERIVNSITIAP